ncbi:MAG: extracellular solute-binding protein [Chloroflexi bacterium]|nr:extracellular solute-binding protein [Chloroflexota bacterium]
MGSPGEAGIRVWEAIGAQFEAANPGVTVDIEFMDDDLYQTIGLPQLLASPNAPDIYFEWTGSRMAQRAADGYAADLTEAVASGPLAGLLDDELFAAATLDGKIVLFPHTADVTNVLWYNVPLFAEHGLTPPTTFEELLAVCDAFVAADIIPIATGNKDLWAAGNWLSHMASRVVGEDVYDATLAAGGPFNTPEWEQAFGYIAQLREHSCVNESANAIADNEGAQLFFQGSAAMHPIGSWLVSWAIDEAPDLEFDFVNLPAMPEGSAGDQGSAIGVETGYMVNANSQVQDLAVEFLALMNSPENVKAYVAAEIVPLARSVADAGVDGRSLRLGELLAGAPAVVLPPDTGYDLEMANALYAAEAAVLGGQATPAAALAALDQQLAR